jgi:DMSO/TMAO reductase YedYZ molybdopterin-dependent catalytic subunit
MNRRTFLSIVALALLTAGGAVGTAEPDAPAPKILEAVNGDGKTISFTAADLAKLPQKEVVAKDRKGEEAKYAGVLVSDVLKSAEVAQGERLRGKLLTQYLVVEAADKYRAVFSLPEIDPDWTDNVVLLATSHNGAALDAAHGPLQIVLPAEKRHSRWVKQVARLTIRSEPE